MSRIVGLILAFSFCCIVGSAAGSPALAEKAEKRVALVIGNAAYTHTTPLRNPANDARDIAAALRRLGFDVVLAIDVTGDQLAEVLGDFLNRAEGADVALLFYAGHGLQYRGRNYLVTIDARLANAFALARETYPFDDIMEAMRSSARISLLFFDACRNNPLVERLKRSIRIKSRAASVGRGLARMNVKGGDTLLVFATIPGDVAADGKGRNSPFTRALLEHIETPGVDVEVMLKDVSRAVRKATRRRQTPERLSRLEIRFMFKPGPGPRERPGVGAWQSPPASAREGRDREEEIIFWQSVMDSKDPAVLQSYLETYPRGRFARLARAKIEALKRAERHSRRTPDPQAACETALEEGSVEALQSFLRDFPGDGCTRRVKRALREEKAWARAKEANTVEAYRAYLRARPDGLYARDAKRKIASLLQPVRPAPAPSRDRSTAFPIPSLPNREESVRKRIAHFITEEFLRDREHFAEWVNYYDKGVVDRAFIMKDKWKYARRWPDRHYELIPGTLSIEKRGVGEWVVTLAFTFRVANWQRGKQVSGRGATRVVLRESGDGFVITDVKEIVER